MFPGVRSSPVVQSPGLESHLRDSGSMPIEVPRPHKPHSTKDKLPILLVKAILSSPEHPVRLTPKTSNISRKVSGSVVGSIG